MIALGKLTIDFLKGLFKQSYLNIICKILKNSVADIFSTLYGYLPPLFEYANTTIAMKKLPYDVIKEGKGKEYGERKP